MIRRFKMMVKIMVKILVNKMVMIMVKTMVMIRRLKIMVNIMLMIRRLAEEGGFRPVEWRWSGLPQVREREISSFWILWTFCCLHAF